MVQDNQDMELGLVLKKLRNKARISGTALADMLGVNKGKISKWENDTSGIELKYVLALSSYYDITIDDIINSKLGEIEKFEIEYLYNDYSLKEDGDFEIYFKEYIKSLEKFIYYLELIYRDGELSDRDTDKFDILCWNLNIEFKLYEHPDYSYRDLEMLGIERIILECDYSGIKSIVARFKEERLQSMGEGGCFSDMMAYLLSKINIFAYFMDVFAVANANITDESRKEYIKILPKCFKIKLLNDINSHLCKLAGKEDRKNNDENFAQEIKISFERLHKVFGGESSKNMEIPSELIQLVNHEYFQNYREGQVNMPRQFDESAYKKFIKMLYFDSELQNEVELDAKGLLALL